MNLGNSLGINVINLIDTWRSFIIDTTSCDVVRCRIGVEAVALCVYREIKKSSEIGQGQEDLISATWWLLASMAKVSFIAFKIL